MAFVKRKGGSIVTAYANRIIGKAEEWLDESDPEMVAFRNRPLDGNEQINGFLSNEVMRAFMKLYAADTGRTLVELRDAIKAHL